MFTAPYVYHMNFTVRNSSTKNVLSYESMHSLSQIAIINSSTKPCPKDWLIWSWLLWFHSMCKSSCVYFTRFKFGLGWCVCVCALHAYDGNRLYIMIQFDTIILTVLSSNIMTNFVYFIGFCLLATPFDLHVVLKYTKRCVQYIIYIMMLTLREWLFFRFD